MSVCHISQRRHWDTQASLRQSSLSILAVLKNHADRMYFGGFQQQGYFLGIILILLLNITFMIFLKMFSRKNAICVQRAHTLGALWKWEGNKEDSREWERESNWKKSHPTQRSLTIINISLCSHWITLYGFTRDVDHSGSLHQGSDYSLYLKQ